MRIEVRRNARDNDGTGFILMQPETYADTLHLDTLFQSFKQIGIEVDEFDWNNNGVKCLRVRVLHMDAGRPGGPPFQISERKA